jgi:hypothetical protein
MTSAEPFDKGPEAVTSQCEDALLTPPDAPTRHQLRLDRQARVGILRNLKEPPRLPPRKAALTGKWLDLRSRRRLRRQLGGFTTPVPRGIEAAIAIKGPAFTMKQPRAWQRMLSGRRLDLLDPTPDRHRTGRHRPRAGLRRRWNGQTHGDWRRSARAALGQDALQGAPMHAQPARGFRDIAVALFIDALDMLPAHAIGRHRVFGRRGQGPSAGPAGRW